MITQGGQAASDQPGPGARPPEQPARAWFRPGVLAQALIALFFATLLFLAVRQAVGHYQAGGDTWRIGDWLINYSAGFVRRGLSGEIVRFISDLIFHDVLFTVLLLQVLCYAVVLLTALAMLLWRQANLAVFALLAVSPALFTYEVINKFSFRKELLFLAMLGVVSLLMARRPSRAGRYLTVALYAMPPLILSHEMNVVFTPYLFLAALAADPGISFFERKYILPVALIAVSFVMVSLYPGNRETALAILDSWKGQVPPQTQGAINLGAISALKLTPGACFWAIRQRVFFPPRLYFSHYTMALVMIAVGFVPLRGRLSDFFRRGIRRWLLAAALVGTFGVMMVAFDWGRLFYANCVCLFFVMACREKTSPCPADLTVGRGLALFVLCVWYAVSWRLPIASEPLVMDVARFWP